MSSSDSMLNLVAGDDQAAVLVARLSKVMQLKPAHEPTRQLLILVDDQAKMPQNFSNGVSISSINDDPIVCTLQPASDGEMLTFRLIQLSLVICLHLQAQGSLLVHGALAERDSHGVILVGPGGIGKTTASRRFRPPWRSLSDDLSLVVRDRQGRYWARPWPTWSRFMFGDTDESWDVHYAVPLKGIFFLTQAHQDRVEALGNGQAICWLVESVEQAWWGIPWLKKEKTAQRIRVQRFENICAMTQCIPTYLLHLSLTGTFWEEIENVLANNES